MRVLEDGVSSLGAFLCVRFGLAAAATTHRCRRPAHGELLDMMTGLGPAKRVVEVDMFGSHLVETCRAADEYSTVFKRKN